MTPENPDGTPVNRAYYAKRIKDRGIDEAIGLCRGIIADGKVVQEEAKYILQWLKANEEAANSWPCSMLAARAAEYLSDGYLDSEEAKDLLDLMKKITGDQVEFCTSTNMSAMFFDSPLPEIVFDNNVFCFTGDFAFGSKKDCEENTKSLGGIVKNGVSKKVDYLIVGSIGSEAWIHTSYGRKIEEAWERKEEENLNLYVVPEDHWANYLVSNMK